mgnify:CR=1 FL=1
MLMPLDIFGVFFSPLEDGGLDGVLVFSVIIPRVLLLADFAEIPIAVFVYGIPAEVIKIFSYSALATSFHTL